MLAFLADAPLASAVLSALPARVPMTTAELSMTFLGDPPTVGGNLLAQAKLVYSDASNGLSEVFITDADGRLVAHGTSRCFVYPPVDLPEMSLSDPAPDEAFDTPDPYLRDGADVHARPMPDGSSGLDILRAEIAGNRPAPPVDELTGIRPVEADDGRVVVRDAGDPVADEPDRNTLRRMVACLAKSAASGAVQTIAGATTAFTALDVKVNYLRPAVVGAGDLVATGTVIHRGRSLAIASAEVVQNGKKIAVATGSTALRSVG
jgi:acyl-coenzyme A thioesterase PaaI-like protein